MTAPAALLALGSGGLVGLVLGLIGGGGSILAVPLLVYVVGVQSPHVAIGTGAVAVALSAAIGLAAHARDGLVRWRCALFFTPLGIAGAAAGSALGRAMNGGALLAGFGVLMIVIGAAMLRDRPQPPPRAIRLTRANAPRLMVSGGAVGLLAGFFGIGGGFLIVPGLIVATGMAMADAVGTSLVSVAAFGFTTAISYAAAGAIDWGVTALLVGGGLVGGVIGTRASRTLGNRRRMLTLVFSACVIAAGLAITLSNLQPW